MAESSRGWPSLDALRAQAVRKSCASGAQVKAPKTGLTDHQNPHLIIFNKHHFMAKLKIYHDTRFTKSDPSKEAPLMIAVVHRSRTSYTPLNLALLPEHWDAKTSKVVKHPKRRMFNDMIVKRINELEGALIRLNEQGRLTNDMSATEIRDILLDECAAPAREIAKFNENTVEKVFLNFMSHKKGGTLTLYKATYKRLTEFAGPKFKTLRFEDINKEWLQRWDDHLAINSPSLNSRGFHLRNLRAVFNDAIDNEITSNYPFRRFKIKSQPTAKRNLKVDIMRKLINADNLEPSLLKYRDFFVLSFMLCGMNVVDMCKITSANINDDRLEYVRTKTHKMYSIKLEPEAMEIINRNRGKKNLLSFCENYQNYRHFYNNLCRGLAKIKEKLGIPELTSYWARHSWATIASSLDIPKDTIAMGLGHGKKDVTDIYLEMDVSKLDRANRKVLDWVLYGQK